MKNETWILSADDVQKIVKHVGHDQLMDTLIADLHLAFSKFNSETIEIPLRLGFSYEKLILRLVEWMPFHEENEEVVIKVVGYHPNNPQDFNLPSILSCISFYNTPTGHIKGNAFGVLLTALRTGAASIIASKYLARAKSLFLGLIGCGAQSVTQLYAVSRLFPIEKVLYYNTDAKAKQSFQERCSLLGLDVTFKESSIEGIMGLSHIVSMATSIGVNRGPLLDDVEVLIFAHINAIGSDFQGKVELPKSLLEKSFISPDFKQQALTEGECQRLETKFIDSELYQVIQGNGKFDFVKNKISVFDFTGWALVDQVIMDLFLKLAKQYSYVEKIVIGNVLKDAKNPYHFLL